MYLSICPNSLEDLQKELTLLPELRLEKDKELCKEYSQPCRTPKYCIFDPQLIESTDVEPAIWRATVPTLMHPSMYFYTLKNIMAYPNTKYNRIFKNINVKSRTEKNQMKLKLCSVSLLKGVHKFVSVLKHNLIHKHCNLKTNW